MAPSRIVKLVVAGGILAAACVATCIAYRSRSAPEAPAQPSLTPEAAREMAAAFLQDPALPTGLILAATPQPMSEPNRYVFGLQWPGHRTPEGATVGGTIEVGHVLGTVMKLQLSSGSSAAPVLPKARCLEAARGLAQRMDPGLFAGAERVMESIVDAVADNGTRACSFQRTEGGFQVPVWASADVNAHDGTVRWFVCGARPYQVPDPATVISEEQALKAADAAVRKASRGKERVVSAPWGGVKGIDVPGPQLMKPGARTVPTYYFHVLTGVEATDYGQVPGYLVWINATSGKLVDMLPGPVSPKDVPRP